MARGKILLVDDEIGVRSFFQDYLENCNFDVVTAEDGIEGLRLFKKGQFDLVISDMMMPGMIGMDLLKSIKAIKADQKVVMMTGVNEDSMKQKAKDLGCLDYITKPLRLADVEEKITRLFPE